MKKALGLLLAIIVTLCTTECYSATPVFASTNGEMSANGIWGGEAYSAGWGHGTFNVNVPKKILRAGMTLKTVSREQNPKGSVLFYVYDPNGRLVTRDEILGANEEDNELKIWNAPAGTYKVEYSVQGTDAPVNIYCWIYG